MLDGTSRIYHTDSTSMSSRRVVVLCILVMWALVGPIAMAFDGCAAMGAMCEGPCGISSFATFIPVLSIALADVSPVHVAADLHLPANAVAGPEPPPKFLSRSA